MNILAEDLRSVCEAVGGLAEESELIDTPLEKPMNDLRDAIHEFRKELYSAKYRKFAEQGKESKRALGRLERAFSKIDSGDEDFARML